MKLFISFCLFSFFLLNPSVSFSQNENRKEVERAGVKYVLHTVSKSETVYSICRKYKVTQLELQQANPGLTTILQAGYTVKIPVAKIADQAPKQEIKTQPAPAESFYYHKVKKKQTIFSIARQYGITGNDLIRYNPELKDGLQAGQILKIPVNMNVSDDQTTGGSSTDVLQDSAEHQVVSGETIYSLEQRYRISHEEMLKNNPALQYGLKAGMMLRIPKETASQPIDPATAKKTYINYKVERGETIFSLATRFGVEVTELKKANPSLLSRSLESGEIILIPQYSAPKKSVSWENNPTANLFAYDTVPVNCFPVSGLNIQKYRVALLLPLHLPGNDKIDPVSINAALLMSKLSVNRQFEPMGLDTTSIINGAGIDPKAEGFIQFYEGALLAIDSLQRKGMNIELYVFDVSNQQMINALLQLDEFRNLDLIIGPVYPELQGTVASFAAKNRIPMVSPLSSSGNFEQNNSWYFKVIPSRESQIELTASYIANEFSNKNLFFLAQSGNSSSDDAKVARLSKEKLAYVAGSNRFHEYSFQRQGVNDLKPLLDKDGENFFMIPTDNEAQVSVAVTNLTALAEHYDIVLMGTPALSKLKSIQTENYHSIRLRYLSPYFIDYKKPIVRRFISQYRELYSNEPTQFSFQGFDVSYYFLSALYRYGKDFRSCLPDYPMELTQMVFNFRKVAPMGGFMNHGMFVTAYERNYDILNYGTVGGK
ncbi:MAG TPA: LysM peptidoglycan-binding domain-containing protein [Prolixibacteraceae bacterium]|nr:LysM peptidoglycan-binding domain-containing protein [Prolixibacteraceae bacterium]